MYSRRIFFSVTSPYLLLQYGILFGLLFVATAGLQWQPTFTAVIFLSAAVWVATLIPLQALRSPNVSDILFASFLLLMLLSAAIQGWGQPWLAANLVYAPFLIICPYLCGRFLQRGDLSVLFRILPLLAVMGILISIWSFATNPNSWLQYRPIINGSDEITARLASLLSCATLVTFLRLTWKTQEVNRYTALYFSIFIAGIILLVFLGLRSILYTCLTTIFLVMLKASWLGIRSKLVYTSAIISIVTFATLSMPMARHFNSKVFTTIAGTTIADEISQGCQASQLGTNSVAIRLELGRNALSDFNSSPIIGTGLGSYGQRACWRSLVAHPHNVVLQALAEMGLIGGSLIVIMLLIGTFRILRERWHRHDYGTAVPILFSFSALNSFTNGNYFTSADFWWAIGAIGTIGLTRDDSRSRM
jgi:O-antigen ligase